MDFYYSDLPIVPALAGIDFERIERVMAMLKVRARKKLADYYKD